MLHIVFADLMLFKPKLCVAELVLFSNCGHSSVSKFKRFYVASNALSVAFASLAFPLSRCWFEELRLKNNVPHRLPSCTSLTEGYERMNVSFSDRDMPPKNVLNGAPPVPVDGD